MSFLQSLFGSPAKQGSTFNKNQLSLIDQIISQVRGQQAQGAQDITQQPTYQAGTDWLQSLFSDPNFFNNIQAPALRQFNEQIAPDLANGYASMGSGGSLGSTGFRNQLAREGSNLATNLSAQRTGLQQQGVNQGLQYAQQPFSNLFNMQNQALQPTQNTYSPATQGLFGPILGALSGGIGAGYGQQLGQRFAGQSPSTY